ncbi:hypothetical protein CJ430_31575, partial [Klebsiella pneumoniae]
GKPIGLQLIAAPFNEQACLRAARRWKRWALPDALRTASGKPIGLQLIAAPFNEQACLRAARRWKRWALPDA